MAAPLESYVTSLLNTALWVSGCAKPRVRAPGAHAWPQRF
jgi:hypothetical protein